MDGCVDGWMDGCVDGWMDGWMTSVTKTSLNVMLHATNVSSPIVKCDLSLSTKFNPSWRTDSLSKLSSNSFSLIFL